MAERTLERYAGASLRRLIRARDLAHDRFDDAITVVDMARAAGLSRAHFLRSFTHVFGVTPHEYLTRVRLERARLSLARGASVTETCFDVGFASLGSLTEGEGRRVHPRTEGDALRDRGADARRLGQLLLDDPASAVERVP